MSTLFFIHTKFQLHATDLIKHLNFTVWQLVAAALVINMSSHNHCHSVLLPSGGEHYLFKSMILWLLATVTLTAHAQLL